ncbi:hypothetical protein [Paenibacillus alkalitolerans]|uniref:hypothetical protein n=1 Tax=Paenibacillus alkalitolerans TaxID=2799335 RepID=UPI0018F437AE|nr:hypothetical protein [Paenibacillus alkalitolerans]
MYLLKKAAKNLLKNKTMKWIGIILTGLCGVVLLGGDKVTSGILLIVTMIIMLLPIKQNKILCWVRLGFVCVMFCLVIWNISTTELPGDRFAKIQNGPPNETYSTGFRFLDQLIHIFKGFLEGRVFIHEPR